MLKYSHKVISLVPSWTETLISAGVNVVGRTRFCIHPEVEIKKIPIVGGTKNIDLQKIKQIQCDYILLDKQENTKQMADELVQAGFQILVTDVTGFKSLIDDILKLSEALNNQNLKNMATRYTEVISNFHHVPSQVFIQQIVIEGEAEKVNHDDQFSYVIWKDPFMIVGKNTFIADNFKLIEIQLEPKEKYPEIQENDLKKTFCFFSSEPFPFQKKFSMLTEQGFKGVVVDGEKLSWFGVRNLTFLETCLKLSK